jgi:lipopolysaccharide biosynthesis glycosyltransferase
MSKTQNAFALIHFGSNPKYFELELYFCIMLQKNTANNIIYMYSEADTPATFIEAIKPFVYKVQGFNDTGITYNVSFESKYTSFNTLRTCDFIFAYLLTDYEKVCIVESDLVLMGNIDTIFSLNAPSILCYRCGDRYLNQNSRQRSTKEEVLRTCAEGSGLNGGVILLQPSKALYDEYVSAIPLIASKGCKYPNEALFEYVNNTFYNLPVKYNLSHYHTWKLTKYGLRPGGEDILVYHFNETDFKHLDIIKDGWLKANENDPKVKEKYKVKKIPINFFEETIYEPNKERVNAILSSLSDTGLETVFTKMAVNDKSDTVKESDWVEGFSKKHQRPYWANKKTGKSVWEKPSELLGGKMRRRTNKRNRRSKKRTNKRRTNNKKTNKRKT